MKPDILVPKSVYMYSQYYDQIATGVFVVCVGLWSVEATYKSEAVQPKLMERDQVAK
jgi:hypothetical protein